MPVHVFVFQLSLKHSWFEIIYLSVSPLLIQGLRFLLYFSVKIKHPLYWRASVALLHYAHHCFHTLTTWVLNCATFPDKTETSPTDSSQKARILQASFTPLLQFQGGIWKFSGSDHATMSWGRVHEGEQITMKYHFEGGFLFFLIRHLLSHDSFLTGF